jgi:hypothetical protein
MYRAALLVNWSWSTSICDALWGGLGAREKPFSVRVLSLFNYFWFKHHYEHSYQRRRLKILYNYDKSYTSIVYIFHFVFIFHNVFIFHFVYIFHYVFLFHFPLHILTWFQIPVTILISWRSIFFSFLPYTCPYVVSLQITNCFSNLTNSTPWARPIRRVPQTPGAV